MSTSFCLTLKSSKRTKIPLVQKSNLLADDAWLADHELDPATGRKKSDRVVTIWESCKVCALQMVGGPRCYEHNPTPEMVEAREEVSTLYSSSDSYW